MTLTFGQAYNIPMCIYYKFFSSLQPGEGHNDDRNWQEMHPEMIFFKLWNQNNVLFGQVSTFQKDSTTFVYGLGPLIKRF